MGRGYGEVTRVKPPLPTVTRKRARDLRREPTDAERKLWQYLRGARVDGLKFRRQHPVPPYIADFCCVARMLIIELDGSQHSPAVDAARTAYLESRGYRMLRFWNNDVLTKTDSVLEAIWNAVHAPDPLPNPRPGPAQRAGHSRRTRASGSPSSPPHPGGRGA